LVNFTGDPAKYLGNARARFGRYLPVERAGAAMASVIGAIGLLLSGVLASAAERVPSRVELLEGGGGVLLLAGLALIASSLPFMP
jgi:hypothetical protein